MPGIGRRTFGLTRCCEVKPKQLEIIGVRFQLFNNWGQIPIVEQDDAESLQMSLFEEISGH
jgi:hypothetical protein